MTCCSNSSWLTARAAASERIEVVIQDDLGLRMPPREAVMAAQQLLQAAANALGMNISIEAHPVPEFLRCPSSKAMLQKSGNENASSPVETSDVNDATRSISHCDPAGKENSPHE